MASYETRCARYEGPHSIAHHGAFASRFVVDSCLIYFLRERIRHIIMTGQVEASVVLAAGLRIAYSPC